MACFWNDQVSLPERRVLNVASAVFLRRGFTPAMLGCVSEAQIYPGAMLGCVSEVGFTLGQCWAVFLRRDLPLQCWAVFLRCGFTRNAGLCF